MAGKSPLAAVATAALLAGLLATPALAASTETEAGEKAAKTVSVSCDEFESTPAVARKVQLTEGTSLVLSLCSNPSTGFEWSHAVSRHPKVASANKGWHYKAPPDEPGMDGAPGTQHTKIHAHAVGNAVITTSYDRQWEGGEKGAWTFRLTVRVRAPKIISVSCMGLQLEPDELAPDGGDVAIEETRLAASAYLVLEICEGGWTHAVSSDPTVASVGGWQKDPYSPPDPPLDGAPGPTQHVKIRAHAAGTAVITAGWPIEGDVPMYVRLTVKVHDLHHLDIGCDEFESTPAVTRSVDLAGGASLELSLCSNPSTGHKWSHAVSSDPKVASVKSWHYEDPPNAMDGAAGTQYTKIHAHDAGTAVITTRYHKAEQHDGTWSLELTINVD
jgi:predicted secreted protein